MESRGVRPSYSALAIGELSEGIAGELLKSVRLID